MGGSRLPLGSLSSFDADAMGRTPSSPPFEVSLPIGQEVDSTAVWTPTRLFFFVARNLKSVVMYVSTG